MNFRQKLRNENGLTLVETLAGLTLFGLVVIVSTGFILNTTGSDKIITTAIEQQRETTALIQEIRRHYHATTGTGDLPLRDLPDGLAIEALAINGAVVDPVSPLTDINFDQPLVLDVTTVNADGETITVQTAWRPNRDTRIVVNP